MKKTFILMTVLLFLGNATAISATVKALTLDSCVEVTFNASKKILHFGFDTEQAWSVTIEKSKKFL